MTVKIDPLGCETKTLLEIVDFTDKRVLEIGVGEGRLTKRYAKDTALTVGIEPKLKEVRTANIDCRRVLGKPISFIQASALALPFRHKTFDIAILAWSF